MARLAICVALSAYKRIRRELHTLQATAESLDGTARRARHLPTSVFARVAEAACSSWARAEVEAGAVARLQVPLARLRTDAALPAGLAADLRALFAAWRQRRAGA